MQAAACQLITGKWQWNITFHFPFYHVILEKKLKLSFIIYDHNFQNKLFSEENEFPWTPFDAGKVAGTATSKQRKRYEIVLSFWSVCLFSSVSHEEDESLFI